MLFTESLNGCRETRCKFWTLPLGGTGGLPQARLRELKLGSPARLPAGDKWTEMLQPEWFSVSESRRNWEGWGLWEAVPVIRNATSMVPDFQILFT